MKHTLFTLALVLLALLSASCGDKKKVVYQNPLPMAFGDPFLLKASDGKFYMYGTGGVQNGFKVYSSDDLVTWKDEGPVYQGGRFNVCASAFSVSTISAANSCKFKE